MVLASASINTFQKVSILFKRTGDTESKASSRGAWYYLVQVSILFEKVSILFKSG